MDEIIPLILRIEGSDTAIRDIAALDAEIKNLRNEMKAVTSENNEAKDSLRAVSAEMEGLEKAGKKGSQAYRDLASESDNLTKAIEGNDEVIKEAIIGERVLREERKKTNQDLNKSIRDFNKFGKAIPNDSIEGLSRRYSDLRKELRTVPEQIRQQAKEFGNSEKALSKLSDENADAIRRFVEMQKEAKKTKDEIIKFDRSINDFSSNIGNYQSAIESLDISSILGKGGSAALGIADGLAGNIGLGSVSELVGALGPQGKLVAAAAAGAIAVGEYVVDITREYEKLFDTVTKVTGAQGDDLLLVTTRVQSISEVFEQDFERVLQSVNNAQKAFGTDFETTLDSIEKGFIALGSGEAQDEFLDSLREYPQLIDNAKFSLDEFVALSIVQSERGIFNDKLVDSVKEAAISLEELTETQEKALSGVFGEDVTKDLERRIREGETTTKEAILEIGKRLEDGGADLQDYAAITADVFKGAGEDVGGFKEVYESVKDAIELANNDLESSTTAYSIRQRELLDATNELNEEQAILAATFAGTGFSFDTLTTKAKALGVSLINDVVGGFRASAKAIENDGLIGGLVKTIGNIFTPLDTLAGEKAIIAKQDADQLAIDNKIAADKQTLEEERIKQRQDEAARQKRIKDKRADEDRERQKEIDKENKRIASEEKKRLKEQEKAQSDAQKAIEKIQKAREKATENIRKLEKEVGDERAKILDLSISDLREYDRQLSLIEDGRESELGSLVGDPNQIEEQTRLINEKFDAQIESIKKKRAEVIQSEGEEEFNNLIDSSNAEDGVDSLNALNDFNNAVAADPSLKVREEAEKLLQQRLLEIQLEGLRERREIVENSNFLSEEERVAKLAELAEQEKTIVETKNAAIIENEQKAAEERTQYLENVATANEAALESIGESIGTFFTNAANDTEDAFRTLANSLKDVILDLIEQQLTLLVTQSFAQPDSVLSFGASGAIRLAVITGLIKGAISGIKNLITFEDGGRVDDGRSLKAGGANYFPAKTGGRIRGRSHAFGGVKFVNRATGRINEAMGGEPILNREQEMRGKMLFGNDFLNRIDPRVFDVGGHVPNVLDGKGVIIPVSGGGGMSKDNMEEFAKINAASNRAVLANMKSDIVDAVLQGLEDDKRKKAARERGINNSRV